MPLCHPNVDCTVATNMADVMEPGTLRSSWMEADYLVRQVEVGDRLEFHRQLRPGVSYTHWAIYIGFIDNEHYAIHLSTEYSDFGDKNVEIHSKITLQGSSAHVRCDAVMRIADDCKCRINNDMDRHCQPFPPRIVVERALIRLGETGYRLLSNNCEHFVNEIRYGSKESTQATLLQSVGLGVVAGVATFSSGVGVVAGLASYAVLSNVSKIQRALPKLGAMFASPEEH
uniref:LRAT domain-containing protein n=2 Tax=Panagrellus redivivus TaxID=6233 RepID=A0A7E4ULG1_PANRE